MASHEHLRGSCQCGRNQYQIRLSDNITDYAHVYFDTSRDNRRFHAAPLTAWLRVPLTWYQSHTQSYFPDETHSTIRRIFSPRHAPHTQRVFCGYCGTPLTYWSEDPREEAEYMSVSIGSLFGDDQRMLEDLELLPPESPPHSSDEEREADEEQEQPAKRKEKVVVSPATAQQSAHPSDVVIPSRSAVSRSYRHGTLGGIPWFEEMVEGSRLGRMMKTRRGVGVSDDQSTSFEWEISEWTSDNTQAAGKRKRGHHTNVEDTEST
ncbi:hypothetical protein CBS63078_5173 [Aspergillus niger]|uniref:Contig An01c0450, genomic contig n=5 Tax=Aspergillus subgen. Circumdati TaxID=2720871 RepID=A2QB56_ASPNC|nr:uncharacterized protein An01g13960 [Aspergillus niger]XP_026623683.1 hypothetical protein BDQ94DRAFT_148296 [Aspergillus welwitschiae]EHA27118.1 hypothetical protein ASPNIDRAFT_55237 [Aspergillus niger ATCC 1015]RDH18702.1 hypothetical protein M747DRAFT_296995 [Aspergillus niger ATCC 13496]KAI2813719.1 hypothetical protein CBS115989_9161 [Aspergillus niger]KAI2827872.1 hypothetical protein CBS133816_6133 [Aspergillus niger]KAI2838603.1 hypothetical protein CBS11350_8075 [Aspergillus niger]|eukprot:XP_001389795.1 hypothetical protein ANI_1_3308014 [Aspergillus niger CBS 513.88]